MLFEYLKNLDSARVQWSDSMPGVRVCRFDLAGDNGAEMRSLPVFSQPLHFETLFCQTGCVRAELSQSCQRTVNEQEILLLSDASALKSFHISCDLRGILVVVDAKAARQSLFSVCQSMGLHLDIGAVRSRMQAQQGCAALTEKPWTQAVFEHLERLPERTHDQYAVFKAVELLYLLCAKDMLFQNEPVHCGDGYIDRSIVQAREYMEQHLAEKLTISVLSRKFSISPTSLKTGFRRMYGQTIHCWLMERRLQQARKLLTSTDMTIQQIAQAVGYGGVSQFNEAFKKYYHTAPGQIKNVLNRRKLSYL